MKFHFKDSAFHSNLISFGKWEDYEEYGIFTDKPVTRKFVSLAEATKVVHSNCAVIWVMKSDGLSVRIL